MSDSTSFASLLPVGPIQRVIVCGSREWQTSRPILDGLIAIYNRELRRFEVVHGGARGADYLAGQLAFWFGLSERPILADWDRLGRRAGFERNTRMLALSPNLVLAFKDGFDYTLRRGGTEHMCRIALESNPPVPVLLYSTARGWERLTTTTQSPSEV